MTREDVLRRLQQLREEYERGQAMLSDLDRQRTDLQAQMLRIAGAIQVLEELMQTPPAP